MRSKYIFLSHELSDKTPTYGNRDRLTITPNTKIVDGDTANSFGFSFSTNHLGTHIDMPFHFCQNGKKVTDVNADYWIFSQIELLDIPCDKNQIIGINDIAPLMLNKDMEILLIKTGFEKYRGSEDYWKNNPGISPDLADYLRAEYPRLRTIGFDFISLTSYQNRALGKKAHLSFLNNEKFPISIVEDMKLSDSPHMFNNLIISPLLMIELDASPVTIFAEI